MFSRSARFLQQNLQQVYWDQSGGYNIFRFSKSVRHKRLLIKLRLCGESGNLHKWLEDWFSARKQRVVINGKASIWRSVPQGSMLDPALFLRIASRIKYQNFLMTQKITSRVTSSVDERELQFNLDPLVTWTEKWQMKFNSDKCKQGRIQTDTTDAIAPVSLRSPMRASV